MADMRELAKRLIAFESASDSSSNPGKHSPARVIEKLRISITRFAGMDGCTALMRRALAITRAEVQGFDESISITNGSKASFEKLTEEACEVLVANLLDLMVTFIGEALTKTLLKDVWPMKTGDK